MKSYALPDPETARDIWQSLAEEKRPLIVYGMGNGADKLLSVMEKKGLSPADFVASDGFVRGQLFHGRRVLSFAEVREQYTDPVFLMAFGTSRPEVMEQIRTLSRNETLYLPDLPVTGEGIFDRDYYRAHYCDYIAVYSALADDTSKDLFAALLQYRLTADIGILFDAANPRADAWRCLTPEKIRSYVDGGAYTGDTLRELLSRGAPLQRALCIEPDRRNFAKLTAYAETLSSFRVTCVRAALWNENTLGDFYDSGNRNASLSPSSYVSKEEKVRLASLDTLLAGDDPDYIKFDIEGAEREGLLGAAATILRARPKIRLAVYHRVEDLFALPLLLQTYCPDYHFYLRRTPCLPAWEIDLIAVPREKGERNDA